MVSGRRLALVVALWIIGAPASALGSAPPEQVVRAEEKEQWPPQMGLELGAEVFAGWHQRWRGDDDFNAWELDRAELQGRWSASARGDGQVGLVLITEVVRAAGERGFFGVDGDSLVVRAKQAWAHGRWRVGGVEVEGRAGLIPDLWVEALESEYGLRGLAPTLAESGQFYDTSDLGAAALASWWGGRLRLGLSLTNGEGRAQREQNRGKNLSGLVSIDILQFQKSQGLILYVGGREGSVGVASVADHRLAAGVAINKGWAGAGGEAVMALGYGDRRDRQSRGLGLWGWAAPWCGGPGLALRLDRQDLARAVDGAEVTRLQGALFYDLLPGAKIPGRLRVYGGYRRQRAGGQGATLPGVAEVSEEQQIFFRLEVMLAQYISNSWE